MIAKQPKGYYTGKTSLDLLNVKESIGTDNEQLYWMALPKQVNNSSM